jgi:hypothetical protein
MKRTILLATMLLAWATSLFAGHGMMNAFNDVDALPRNRMQPARSPPMPIIWISRHSRSMPPAALRAANWPNALPTFYLSTAIS